MWLAGYRLLLWLAWPWLIARLYWRSRREPGYRNNPGQRFGFYDRRKNPGPLIWVHAVSVGETRAAQPLILALMEQYPAHHILLTQMTAAGREAAQQLYGPSEKVELAWLPYDYPLVARRFLRHYRPGLCVILETEIWPNFLEACARAGVPVLLASARMSERSARRYALVAGLAAQALRRFAAIAAQSDADAQKLLGLGAPAERVLVTGNLKFDVPIPVGAQELAQTLRRRVGDRKVLLAASLREGEEELLLQAIQAAGGLNSNALLLIVPRHPQRFDEVAALLRRRGLSFIRRSEPGAVPPGCACMLGDSMGEMAAYYAACDCAFVGGSLLEYGGQNLIEACAAGVPVLFGPHTYNFAQVAEAAILAGAAVRLPEANSVIAEANRLLLDDDLRRRMGVAGREFYRLHQGATARTMDLCARLLPLGHRLTNSPAGD